jgi:hypothetical protein
MWRGHAGFAQFSFVTRAGERKNSVASEVQMLSKRIDVLESGKVYFFFRAEVEEAAEKLEEAQRMFVVLVPDEPPRYRLLVIRRRSFSQDSEIDRTSGFVDTVSGEPKRVEVRLAPEAHQRKISGESHLPALRPIGEGVYRIIRHDDHTHFAYVLELPKASGGAQASFTLENQANYIISMKNPQQRSGFATDLQQPADLPKRLQEKFGDRRFCEADPPDFLNHAGLEFVLIAAGERTLADRDIEELGIKLQPELERVTSNTIFHDLKTEISRHPPNPFLRGAGARES